MDSKDLKEISKILPSLGQVGLSIVVPILFCIFICYLLTTKCGVGYWVYIPGFVFGLGGAFASMFKIYNTSKKKENEKKPVAFNIHS